MSEAEPPLRIFGGRVIDPASGIDGPGDVLIANGRVVDSHTPKQASAARTIDATGLQVLPGGSDMHSHIASRGVALAQTLTDGEGQLVPLPSETGRGYAELGFTTVIDAAVPVAEADFAHRRLDETTGIDAGFLLEVGSDLTLIEELARLNESEAVDRLAALVRENSAYGLKLVNPGLTDELDEPIAGTSLTPRRLMRLAATAADRYDFPHPLHLHTPHLGEPGNLTHTRAAIEALDGHRLHLAHAQFAAYAAADDGGYVGGAEAFADLLASHPQVTADAGCITFGPAMMISRDRLLARRLARAPGQQPTEQGGWAAMPLRYRADHPVNALQWALGLELILRCAPTGRIALTVDHPNGGPFAALADLMRLLANPGERAEQLHAAHPWARERTGLPGLGRAMSEDRLVALTRSAPAAALGLAEKGHLAPGAAADVVLTPRPHEPAKVVIHGGRVLYENGQWLDERAGRRLRALA
jgi:formylmethanofuran dehydrogenase subunit A